MPEKIEYLKTYKYKCPFCNHEISDLLFKTPAFEIGHCDFTDNDRDYTDTESDEDGNTTYFCPECDRQLNEPSEEESEEELEEELCVHLIKEIDKTFPYYIGQIIQRWARYENESELSWRDIKIKSFRNNRITYQVSNSQNIFTEDTSYNNSSDYIDTDRFRLKPKEEPIKLEEVEEEYEDAPIKINSNKFVESSRPYGYLRENRGEGECKCKHCHFEFVIDTREINNEIEIYCPKCKKIQ